MYICLHSIISLPPLPYLITLFLFTHPVSTPFLPPEPGSSWGFGEVENGGWGRPGTGTGGGMGGVGFGLENGGGCGIWGWVCEKWYVRVVWWSGKVGWFGFWGMGSSPGGAISMVFYFFIFGVCIYAPSI